MSSKIERLKNPGTGISERVSCRRSQKGDTQSRNARNSSSGRLASGTKILFL